MQTLRILKKKETLTSHLPSLTSHLAAQPHPSHLAATPHIFLHFFTSNQHLLTEYSIVS